ncbi:MAG: acyl carrier protein [Deltaproteobacteria bacterium]|nr:MAG: acyl carrier protein [Deltaproteobacteria bacterium]
MSPNDLKLRNLLVETLLIDDDQYRDENGPDTIETWDSLAMVRIAVGVKDTFGYDMTPEEMVSLESIGDIKAILRSHDIAFDQ